MGIPGSCNVLRVWRPIPGQDAVAGGPEAGGFVRQGERLFQSGRRRKSVFGIIFLGGLNKVCFLDMLTSVLLGSRRGISSWAAKTNRDVMVFFLQNHDGI